MVSKLQSWSVVLFKRSSPLTSSTISSASSATTSRRPCRMKLASSESRIMSLAALVRSMTDEKRLWDPGSCVNEMMVPSRSRKTESCST